MSSFAVQTKINLCDLHVKSICCKKSLLFGVLFYGGKFGIGDITVFTECEEITTLIERLLLECYSGVCDIEYYSSGFRLTVSDHSTMSALIQDRQKFKSCNKCRAYYLRGIFLACGTVNSPDASYRLELSFKRSGEELERMLTEMNLNYKSTIRGNENVFYIKESESVEDFLNYIGAMNAAFLLMNEKIKRGIRNDVNRQKNCDTANIKKTIAANQKQIDAINRINRENKMGMLPEALRVTAQLRVDYPHVSLVELAELHDPKITKSGLNNRMRKIMEFADK